MQLFERQNVEDGDLTTRVWAADRSPLRGGEEDPDNDDYLPILRANRKGKQPDHTPVYHISGDEDDDCQILDPIDVIPISWSPPCVPAKSDATTSRKQANASGSDAPPPKKPKKVVAKPSRLKNMLTNKG